MTFGVSLESPRFSFQLDAMHIRCMAAGSFVFPFLGPGLWDVAKLEICLFINKPRSFRAGKL